jgi:hypothetical protein
MAQHNSGKSGLSASLHVIYQKYKAGKAIVVDWLVAHGGIAKGTKRLSVRELLRLAKKCTQQASKPPGNVQAAFKLTLVNRKQLTTYYEHLEDSSQSTAEGTERHKFFNETLAEAYDALFPATKDRIAKAGRNPSKLPPPSEFISNASASNRFDVLSGLIEQEPDSDSTNYTPLDIKESSTTSSVSTIEDDPMEEFIVMHAYILEVECVMNLVNGTWAQAAEGTLPILIAGSLTNIGMQQLRYLTTLCGP